MRRRSMTGLESMCRCRLHVQAHNFLKYEIVFWKSPRGCGSTCVGKRQQLGRRGMGGMAHGTGSRAWLRNSLGSKEPGSMGSGNVDSDSTGASSMARSETGMGSSKQPGRMAPGIVMLYLIFSDSSHWTSSRRWICRTGNFLGICSLRSSTTRRWCNFWLSLPALARFKPVGFRSR